MGVFGRGAREGSAEASLARTFESRTLKEDEGHEHYFAAVQEIELEYANVALARKLGDPLSRDAAASATRLMPVTGAQGISPLEDGVRAAYIASYGETWAELDGERVRVTARECCEVASRGTPETDNGRMRAGTAILGLIGNHPDHTKSSQAFPQTFRPLYDYVSTQASHQRLTEAGANSATGTVQAFRSYISDDPADTPEAERCYRLAWQLGLSIWIWQECGFFNNPALEPGL